MDDEVAYKQLTCKGLLKSVYADFVEPDVLYKSSSADMFVMDVLLSLGSPVTNVGTETMATDGKRIYYNPIWMYDNVVCGKLTSERDKKSFVRFMLAHEALHISLAHPYEFSDVDKSDRFMVRVMNIAADLAVNDMLFSNGITINSEQIGYDFPKPGYGLFSKYPKNHDCRFYFNMLLKDIADSTKNDTDRARDLINSYKDGGDVLPNDEKDETAESNTDSIDSNMEKEEKIADIKSSYSEKMRNCRKIKEANGEKDSASFSAGFFALPPNISVKGEKINAIYGGKPADFSFECISGVSGKIDTNKINWNKILSKYVHKAYNEFTRKNPNKIRLGTYVNGFGTVPVGFTGEEFDDIYFVVDVSGSMDNRYIEALAEIVGIIGGAKALVHVIAVNTKIQDEYLFSSRKISSRDMLSIVGNGKKIPKRNIFTMQKINEYKRTGIPSIEEGGGTKLSSALVPIRKKVGKNGLVFMFTDGDLETTDLNECIKTKPIWIITGNQCRQRILDEKCVLLDAKKHN